MSSMRRVRASISAAGRFSRRIPNATFSATVMWGKSAYCWKTVFTGRRLGGSPSISSP